MTAKQTAGWMSALVFFVATLAGCGKGGDKSGSGKFEGAPTEIKEAWARAVAADKADDYVTAVAGYKQVISQRDQLQPAQIKVAEEASGKLFQRIVDASSKGDAAAQRAIATLGAMDRGRGGVPR